MTIFRGPKEGTLPDGSVIATQGDIAEALTEAIAAKGAAESAQAAAEAALDTFGDQYLGTKTSDPTVDNDGDPLIDGALYYNTTDNVVKVYDLGNNLWRNLTLSDAQQANINTVANIETEVVTVSDNVADVQTVATDLSGADTIGIVSTNITDVNSVGQNIADVTTVSTNLSGTDTIGTVATSIADVQTVSTNISDVNTAADNIGAIQDAPQFASDAEDAQGYAEEWANKPEDTLVSTAAGGDGVDDFSALHFSAKASTSASAASTSESNALTSEQNAATSASEALTSEQNAAQSESNASTSEQNAQQAATDAETALDNFTDQYLGVKASDPATDNDGDPLLEGAIYYNSTNNQLLIYDGTIWVQAAFSVDGSVTSFNGRTGAISLNSVDVENALGYTPQDESTSYDSTNFDTDFGTKTTDDLTEGATNLYYADTLVDSHLIGGTGVTYNAGDISIGQDVSTTASVTFLDAQFTGTSAITIPDGTESQRPASPQTGMLRFNTDVGNFEQYDGTQWVDQTKVGTGTAVAMAIVFG